MVCGVTSGLWLQQSLGVEGRLDGLTDSLHKMHGTRLHISYRTDGTFLVPTGLGDVIVTDDVATVQDHGWGGHHLMATRA